MFRFIHSSDLHIGKRYGNMPEDVRGRLREARHGAITRLAEQARTHGASTILLAGDTFDTETPSPAMLRQALAEMGAHAPLQWVILPGNHDSLVADELWTAAGNAAPPNVFLALKPIPLPIRHDVALLPSPCTTRRPGRDLTEWMETGATEPAMLRIGLAHGAIQSFSENGEGTDIIAPDRARRAGLDYLALGDWHGQIRVNERTWYAGTPEPDRFKHNAPGQALLVSIAGPGALPDVRPLDTGSFNWRTIPLPLLASDDGAAALHRALPAGPARRQILLRIAVSGRTGLTGRTALKAAVDTVTPEFAHVLLDEDALAIDCESTDLDQIDHAGALRVAAEALLAESIDTQRASSERDIARAALVRLFSYCETVGS